MLEEEINSNEIFLPHREYFVSRVKIDILDKGTRATGRRALYDPLDESKDAGRKKGGGGRLSIQASRVVNFPLWPDETCTLAKSVLVKGDACIEFSSEEDC